MQSGCVSTPHAVHGCVSCSSNGPRQELHTGSEALTTRDREDEASEAPETEGGKKRDGKGEEEELPEDKEELELE